MAVFGSWIELEHLPGSDDRLRHIARDQAEPRLAPPGHFERRLERDRSVEVGFRLSLACQLQMQPSAVRQKLSHVRLDGECGVERRFRRVEVTKLKLSQPPAE